jgi:hypothetical protein
MAGDVCGVLASALAEPGSVAPLSFLMTQPSRRSALMTSRRFIGLTMIKV